MFPHFQRFSDWEWNAEEQRVNKLSCGHQLNRTGIKISSTHIVMQLLRKPEPNARPAHRKEVVKWLLHLFIVTSRRRLIHPSGTWRIDPNTSKIIGDHAHALAILSLHFFPGSLRSPPIIISYFLPLLFLLSIVQHKSDKAIKSTHVVSLLDALFVTQSCHVATTVKLISKQITKLLD